MENTLENKAKFFAQYWGQEVFGTPFMKGSWGYSGENYDGIDNSVWVNLTPLNQISDEDAIDFARISLYHPTIEGYCADDVWIGEAEVNPNGDHWLQVGMRCWEGALIVNDQTGTFCLKDEDDNHEPIHNVVASVDYLRSKGYALPWMGLSIDILVEYGWVKLKDL